MRVVATVSAEAPAVLHAVLAYCKSLPLLSTPALTLVHSADSLRLSAAFLCALVVGVALHYEKIVRNAFHDYPQEWLPSVSATIGDWFPERNLFQFLIALTSGPRIALIVLSYLVKRCSDSSFAGYACVIGLLRTVCCGGWVYVTSSDSGAVHDFFMLS